MQRLGREKAWKEIPGTQIKNLKNLALQIFKIYSRRKKYYEFHFKCKMEHKLLRDRGLICMQICNANVITGINNKLNFICSRNKKTKMHAERNPEPQSESSLTSHNIWETS